MARLRHAPWYLLSPAALFALSTPVRAGQLFVSTHPPDAAILIDGVERGRTPASLRSLPEGVHELKVLKEGYLENRRRIRVGGAGLTQVEIRLTPAPAATTQVEQEQEKRSGGGKKKLLFIGAGAALAGGAAYLALRGEDLPPVAGTVSVSPQAQGMAGLTTYTFVSQGASDPEGRELTYSWSFSDGSTASGPAVFKIFETAGAFTAELTVKDRKHAVKGTSLSVTVRQNLTANWGGGTACRSLPFTVGSASFQLSQARNQLTGQASATVSGSGALSGRLEGDGTGVATVSFSGAFSNGDAFELANARYDPATDAVVGDFVIRVANATCTAIQTRFTRR